MRVAVTYCLPGKQKIMELDVVPTCTVQQALEQSGILNLAAMPEIDLLKVGIYGKTCSLETKLHENDRVEIYRDLLLSPTQARKLRAKSQLAKSRG